MSRTRVAKALGPRLMPRPELSVGCVESKVSLGLACPSSARASSTSANVGGVAFHGRRSLTTSASSFERGGGARTC